MQEKIVKPRCEFKAARQFTHLRKMIDTITELENQYLQKAKLYDRIMDVLVLAETATEKIDRIEQITTQQVV